MMTLATHDRVADTLSLVLRKLKKNNPSEIGLLSIQDHKGWLVRDFDSFQNALRYSHAFDEMWYLRAYENWHEVKICGETVAEYSI